MATHSSFGVRVILLLDNYDSFTFNLAQAFWELGAELRVLRSDTLSLDDVEKLSPTALVISPGPGRPGAAGISLAAIRAFSGRIPILGVCLGHQAIGEVFGATLGFAKRVLHGKSSRITHSGAGLFAGLPTACAVGRYHSLSLQDDSLPDSLEVTAVTEDDGEVMAVRHRTHPTVGVQFHPESVLTPDGPTLLRNFLEGRLC
jgi:anthranilate synthase/aminodeoxychorismate synthase-like glutamine amidotransferase